MEKAENPSEPRGVLLRLADDRGVSLARLSTMIGRNTTYLQQFVRKGSPRKLEENDRVRLARFFGVDDSLLRDMEVNSYESTINSPPEWVDIPRLALGAAAGSGAFAEEERAIGAFRFASVWLRGQGLDPAMLSAIAVTGDSMEPLLRDGDEVLVDRAPRALRDGIHVVRIDDILLVKRLETGRPGVLALLSDNPAYRPIEVSPEAVQIIGRVVWKSGRI